MNGARLLSHEKDLFFWTKKKKTLQENQKKVLQFFVLTRAIFLLFIDPKRTTVNTVSLSTGEIKAMSSSICVGKIEFC